MPEGIRFEREQLAGLRRLATAIIDTSELNVHQLKELVIARIKGEQGAREMTVHLQSFGYRFGIPLNRIWSWMSAFCPILISCRN